jgi:hypothetical protein
MRAAFVLFLVLSGCSRSKELFPADEAQRICLTMQACSPLEFQRSFGGSLEFCTTNPSPGFPLPGTIESPQSVTAGLDRPLGDLYGCMLDAGSDCAKAGRCWAFGLDAGECSFARGLQSSFCNRSVMSGCTLDGQPLAVNCALYDAGCVWLGAYAGCSLGPCTARPGCRGEVRELCIGNSIFLEDCSRNGQRCENRDGGARCVGEVACARKDLGRCEGTIAISCPNEFEARIDCALNPTRKRCDKGVCVETGTQCSGLRETCEGTAVKYCQDGFTRKVDCVSAGFSGCDAGACVPHE